MLQKHKNCEACRIGADSGHFIPTPTDKETELREKWNKEGAPLNRNSDEDTADWWLNELKLAVQEAEQRGYERAKIERLVKEDLELKVKTGY